MSPHADLEALVATAVGARRDRVAELVAQEVDRQLAALVEVELASALERLASRNGSEPEPPNPPEPAQRRPCKKCGEADRLPKCVYCRECRRAYDREWARRNRKRKRAAKASQNGSAGSGDDEPHPADSHAAGTGSGAENGAEPLEAGNGAPGPGFVDELDLPRDAALNGSRPDKTSTRLPASACGRLIYDPLSSARWYCPLDHDHDGPCSKAARPATSKARAPAA